MDLYQVVVLKSSPSPISIEASGSARVHDGY